MIVTSGCMRRMAAAVDCVRCASVNSSEEGWMRVFVRVAKAGDENSDVRAPPAWRATGITAQGAETACIKHIENGEEEKRVH